MPDETTSTPLSSRETEATAATGSALLVQDEARDPSRATANPLPEESPLAALPMQLDVTIPIPSFRVQDLLALEKGVVLESHWPPSEDVPVWSGGVQLVWTEFEVIDQKLAVRVTRIG